MAAKVRKKSWEEKVALVKSSYLRAKEADCFGQLFYQNLFFLNPKIKVYFKKTNFKKQEKALIDGLDFLFDYFEEGENARVQMSRLATVHNIDGLNVHPQYYYYWSEALVMTMKKMDYDWYHDLEYYFREVISYPISFFISQYFVR